MKERATGEISFESIFTQYYKPLCLFANSYIKDMPAAEDIVEESFIKLWESRHEIRHASAMYAWLCTTIKNKALNAIRARKNKATKQHALPEIAPADDQADHLERILKAELICELYQLIHSLPPQCSKVFVKLYIEDKSVDETSVELGLSVNTIKSHKARGLDLLRHKLSPVIILLLNL